MTASNFTDDLRVPRTGEVTDGYPIDIDKVVIGGVTYYRQKVTEASAASILAQITTLVTEAQAGTVVDGGAVTIQDDEDPEILGTTKGTLVYATDVYNKARMLRVKGGEKNDLAVTDIHTHLLKEILGELQILNRHMGVINEVEFESMINGE